MLRSACRALVLFFAAAGAAFAAQPELPRDQVSFRVEASRDVPNDWVAATLGVDEEGGDPAALAARVNERMTAAQQLAKSDPRLLLSSGAYQTQPVYDRTRIVRWRASQDLVLETADVAALTDMAGKLQGQGLLLRHVAFSVGPETKKRIEDELIVEALSLFRERAGLIARGLGRRGWNLINVSVGDSGMPVPMYRTQAMAADSSKSESAPSFESGRTTLRIEVHGTVEIDK